MLAIRKSSFSFLQFILTVAIFFASALLIFVLRGRDRTGLPMPYVVDKNFFDVYPELQRLQLRIKISRREYLDLPTGLILSQNVPEAQTVFPHDSLRLVINQPRPFLKMPNLIRASLEQAKASLTRIPYRNRTYSLKIESIAKVYTDEFSHQTIITQFPPPNELVGLENSVYLLIALNSPKTRKEQTKPINRKGSSNRKAIDQNRLVNQKKIPALIGQNLGIAAYFFYHAGIDYRIRGFQLPSDSSQNGILHKIAKTNKGKYLLDVYHSPRESYAHNSYERVELKLGSKGVCTVRKLLKGSNSSQEEQIVFSAYHYEPREKVELLFYLSSPSLIQTVCGKKTVYTKFFGKRKFKAKAS